MLSPATSSPRRGSAIVSSLVVLMGLFGVIYATTVMSVVEVRQSRNAVVDLRSRHLAEAGVEHGLLFVKQAVQKAGIYDPVQGLAAVFNVNPTLRPFEGEPVMDGNGQVGAYTVSMTATNITTESITLRIDATGYVPDAPQNLAPGQRVQDWEALSVTVQYSLEPSQVFDYAYFINNWGWFYGNTIQCNGNARSNGQFDAAGYAPHVGGQPLYERVEQTGSGIALHGYKDDNGDGLMDGNDGGVFSGWDIVGAQNLTGVGGQASNQHDFEDPVEMPNLTELAQYEAKALAAGSSLSIGGTVVSDAVFGDGVGETGNLYLEGTLADPIVLDGPVVVQGDVIIKGYVTGQGSIYAGGNVYVPDSIEYVDPPATPRPPDNTQAATEQWLTDNWDKDLLGLLARENIVVGDHTHSSWRYYVGNWMASSMNASIEDSGEDNIPNTSNGMDGIHGTADDDVLENDGVFTVQTYTAEDAALGLIPPGKSVGDVIPGSGEDIDGDGQFDTTISLADIDFSTPLDTANWGGNMPSGGITNYSDVATLYANNRDAFFYTNHSFSYVVFGSDPARVNGSIVCRNENIVYGTPSVEINYDNRLLGGNTGAAAGLIPQTLQAPVILGWTELDDDPNHYAQP